MNQKIIRFLESYSFESRKIDALIITAFLQLNGITNIKNRFINNMIIKSGMSGFDKVQEFVMLVDKFEIEDLIEIFEFVISPADKIVTGAVYTPKKIRSFIIENSFIDLSKIKSVQVCDLACGCGSFLYEAAKFIKAKSNRSYFDIFKEQLFGLDIQKYSIERTKIFLILFAITEEEDKPEFLFNLFSGDALNFSWDHNIYGYKKFDVIIGNPPYVCSRHINESSRQLLSNWEVCSSGHPDLYIPFFQIALENINENGIIGFITMNTFFKSLNGRSLRKYFQRHCYMFKIIDFGSLQVFKSKSTYTCICILQNKQSEFLEYKKCFELDNLCNSFPNFYNIAYNKLNDVDGWNLSHHFQIISKIEAVGIPLGNKFETSNGVATLKNDIFIFKPVKETKHFLYLENDEALYPIEKSICKDIINPNLLTTQKSLGNILEKIIYPYELKNKKIFPISEDTMLEKFPKALEYLKTNKKILSTRDGGKAKKYIPWYRYGRNQSLELLGYKLFFPHITPKTPNFSISTIQDLLFYNGIAIVGKTKRDLLLLKKILSSKIFWFYIKHSSKPYDSNYYSLSRTYIKNFGLPILNEQEEIFLIHEHDQNKVDTFIEKKYQIVLPLD